MPRIRTVRGDDAVRSSGPREQERARSFENAPITGQVRLTDGAVIQIGSVELKLRIWSEGKSPETERIPKRKQV